MLKIFFHLSLFLFLTTAHLLAQPVTFLKVFDPNPQFSNVFDKRKNLWSIGENIFIDNGYLNLNNDRVDQIFKIHANSREIVKQITIDGPQGDLAISSEGGYCITSDNHVLITGEWKDYVNTRMGTFLAKLDSNLHQVWIKFFPELPLSRYYGDGVAETVIGLKSGLPHHHRQKQ